MGCGASKPHTTVHLPPESSLRRTITPDPQSLAHGPQPTIRTAAEVLTIRLLDGLAAREQHVSLPVQSHAQRLGSAQRGWSCAAFRGLRAFYSKHGMLDKVMADLCKQEAAEHEASSRLSWSTSPRRPPAPVMSMCQLTKSTGLSLAESLVLAADGTEIATQVIGKATSFLSYSRTGTRLRDMFDAIERLLTKLEAQDGRTRYVWVDLFCASQTLLAGAYRDAAVTKDSDPEGYRAREEDTSRLFDDVIDAVDETLVYVEPLAGEWRAPQHPFLQAEQAAPAEGWMRRGPSALTRAWCIFELAKSLSKERTLHVMLGAESAAQFADTLCNDPGGHRWVGQILVRVDVKQAQISNVADRAYILGELGKLPGGLGAVNSSVSAALREWVIGEAEAMLAMLPEAKRGTSLLLSNVATMMQEQGRLAEAEALMRVQLAAWRKEGGDRHLHTLARLGNLANNLQQQEKLLQLQGKLAEAETLFREAVAAYREVKGNDHQNTMVTVGNLGKVLLTQGKLEEADPLLVEAVAWARKTYGSGGPYNGALVELRREQGRLAEAEQELGALAADAHKAVGPQHPDTLEAEAIAARLKHAQPDGAAAGAAELRAVVERMTEFLGAAHQDTRKWQRVLEEMPVEFVLEQ